MRTSWKLMPLLICSIALLLGCGNPALEHLEQGDAYRNQKQWASAITEYSKAIELDPGLAKAYYGRGFAYTEKGEYDHALADLNEAIEFNPGFIAAYNNRGFVYNQKGQYDLAITDFSKAIELDPDWAPPYINRGWAYNNKRQYDLAITDFNKAIELDPGVAVAYSNRGFAYGEKGQYDLAITDFNKAIELDPDWPNAHNNRGCTYNEKGQYDLAITDFSKAIELDPDWALPYINRGWAYNHKGQYDLAIVDLNKAIELDPRLAVAYYNRGFAYNQKGQYDLAVVDLNKVAELSDNPALIQLAQIELTEAVRAEEIRHLQEETKGKNIIIIDGVTDEWPSDIVVVSDPAGDVSSDAKDKKGIDLKEIRVFMDEYYLYVAIQIYDVFDASLVRNYFIALDFDKDQRDEYHFGVRPNGNTWVFNHTIDKSNWNAESTVGVVAIGERDTIEIKIPRNDYQIPANILILCRVTEGGSTVDITEWFKAP